MALAESESHALAGALPNGEAFTTQRPRHQAPSLVMFKLLALFDRYHNIRGPQEARHDREEAGPTRRISSLYLVSLWYHNPIFFPPQLFASCP